MSFEVKQTEGKEIFIKFNKAEQLTEKALRRTWFAVGADLIRTANREILKKPRKGRVYFRRIKGGRKRKHIASRPGEYHANLTGETRRSMGWKVRGYDLEFGYGVTKPAPERGKWLEDGTKRMQKRPSLANSIRDNQRNIENHFINSVTKELK